MGALPPPRWAKQHADGAAALTSRAIRAPCQSVSHPKRGLPRLPEPRHTPRDPPALRSPWRGLREGLRCSLRQFAAEGLERVELVPKLLRVAEPVGGHLPECAVVLGEHERRAGFF